MCQSPKRIPRLSLLSLMLVMTCVALGFGLWRSSQRAEAYRIETARALEENRRLRDAYGEFEITDPSLLHAVRMHPDLESGDHRDWAWRIATPEGKRVIMKYADGVIQAPTYTGVRLQDLALPKPTYQQTLEPGFHTIRLSFDYDPHFPPAKAWQWEMSFCSYWENSLRKMSTRRAMTSPAWPSLINQNGPLAALFQPSEVLTGGDRRPVAEDAFAPDKPLVLQRMRVQTVDRKLVPPTGFRGYDSIPEFNVNADAPGFIIWLEPAK